MPSLSMIDENGRCNIINFLQIAIYHDNEKYNTPISYNLHFYWENKHYPLHCIFHFLLLCCLSIKHVKVLFWFTNGVFYYDGHEKKNHVKFGWEYLDSKALGTSPNEELCPISLLHVHTFESTQNTKVNISIKKPRTKLD
jgi:hypothetical protein